MLESYQMQGDGIESVLKSYQMERTGELSAPPLIERVSITRTVCEGSPIKGIIFDCYQTLIDIHTDEDAMETYERVAMWLAYQGVKVSPEKLRHTYVLKVKERMDRSEEEYPEVKVEEIHGITKNQVPRAEFRRMCRELTAGNIDKMRQTMLRLGFSVDWSNESRLSRYCSVVSFCRRGIPSAVSQLAVSSRSSPSASISSATTSRKSAILRGE